MKIKNPCDLHKGFQSGQKLVGGECGSCPCGAVSFFIVKQNVVSAVDIILDERVRHEPHLVKVNARQMFGEPFTFAHGVLFGCLWAGIALIAAMSARNTTPIRRACILSAVFCFLFFSRSILSYYITALFGHIQAPEPCPFFKAREEQSESE